MKTITDSRSVRRCAIALQKNLQFFLIALTLGLGSNQIIASVIFQDDFSRSNSNDPGANWISVESDENDIAIYNQQLRLRDYLNPSSTHVSLFIDASAFTDISLSFSWRVLSSTESSHSLTLSIDENPETQKQALFSTGLGSAGTYSKSLRLQDHYLGWVGFWLDVNSSSEAVYIDNVHIRGDLKTTKDQLDPFEVSEASSFALLVAGLLGLIGVRRKHKAPEIQSYNCAA